MIMLVPCKGIQFSVVYVHAQALDQTQEEMIALSCTLLYECMPPDC